MKLLMNPVVLRMGVVFIIACIAFFVGVIIIRRLRSNFISEAHDISQAPIANDGLPVHAFQAVIQQLKQEKHALAAQQQADRRKAKTSDTLSATVLANLSCGVLFFNTAGLVRQANAAARKLLGFASPVGLSIDDLFRGAAVRDDFGRQHSTGTVREALASAFSGENTIRGVLADYTSRAGERLLLELTASPVLGDEANLLGTTIVLTDKTEIERIRQEEQLRGEISSEMALALRNSLTTIAGYAQQLAQSKDPDLARQLADDVANEAARLDRTTVRFLAGAKKASAGI